MYNIIMTVVVYNVHVIWMYACLYWLFYDDTHLYIVHVYNHTARQLGVSSLQTGNLFAMTKTCHIVILVQDNFFSNLWNSK